MIFSTRFLKILCVLSILMVFSMGKVTPVSAVSIVVNTTKDEVIDDEYCSLREAVQAANDGSNFSGCTGGASRYITLPAGVYTVDIGQLPNTEADIIIHGDGPGATIIQPADCDPTVDTCLNHHRLFYIYYTGTLTLDHLTVRYGKCTDNFGGAIYNAGRLNIIDSVFKHNKGYNAGAISNANQLTIIRSTFSGNTADNYDGGAVQNLETGNIYIEDSTFEGNTAQNGGALWNKGTVDIVNSTFSGNISVTYSDHQGGAIYNRGDLTITNSTFDENAAENSTAGIYNYVNGQLSLINTIIANSTAGTDCDSASGTIIVNINNLIEDDSCGPDFSGDPSLGPLADNGGPTQTHALLKGSNAIDKGDLTACPAVDQRGVARPKGLGCDLGAYELEYYASFIALFTQGK